VFQDLAGEYLPGGRTGIECVTAEWYRSPLLKGTGDDSLVLRKSGGTRLNFVELSVVEQAESGTNAVRGLYRDLAMSRTSARFECRLPLVQMGSVRGPYSTDTLKEWAATSTNPPSSKYTTKWCSEGLPMPSSRTLDTISVTHGDAGNSHMCR
jgi:hypothetical protein